MDYKDRRNKILNIVSGSGFADIKNLKDEFNVSEMTIYRDLEFLEKKGLLTKTTVWITKEMIYLLIIYIHLYKE